MNFIKLFFSPKRLISFIFWFIFFTIIEFSSYAVTSLLNQKKQTKKISNLTEEETEQINAYYETAYQQFDVEKGYKDNFIKTLKYFASFDESVVYDPEKKQLAPLNLQYILNLFEKALEGLDRLGKVSKDDKTIAYYESTSKIDDLIKYYEDRLRANGEQALLLKATRNEFRLKKWLAHMKKNHGLFLNMYLTVFTLFPLSKMKITDEEKEIMGLMQHLFSFYSLGHATPKQIQKSLAIQIYRIYEKHEKIKKIDDLKDQIGNLIDYIMHTEIPYKNFNDINEEPYIKNIVHEFIIFDCNTDKSRNQMKSFRRYMITKGTLHPWWFSKFLRVKFFDKLLDSPLPMYRRMALLTFFGFYSKKK